MLLLGLDGLSREEIGLKNSGEIIFGAMSAALRRVVLGLLSGYGGMKAKTQIWLDWLMELSMYSYSYSFYSNTFIVRPNKLL